MSLMSCDWLVWPHVLPDSDLCVTRSLAWLRRGAHVALNWGTSVSVIDSVLEYNGKHLVEYPTTLATVKAPNTDLEPNVVGYDIISDGRVLLDSVTVRDSIGGVFLGCVHRRHQSHAVSALAVDHATHSAGRWCVSTLCRYDFYGSSGDIVNVTITGSGDRPQAQPAIVLTDNYHASLTVRFLAAVVNVMVMASCWRATSMTVALYLARASPCRPRKRGTVPASPCGNTRQWRAATCRLPTAPPVWEAHCYWATSRRRPSTA